ncbi:MAG: sulfotransferase [Ectothiorhodospiraceae bacterium]|nr:sulfotransferase [Ectothiorhodospiraceae bacterium]
MGYSALVKKIAVALGGNLKLCAGAMLKSPVFVVGFNKSGKSLITSYIANCSGVSVFPGEGNDVLWFKGLYPRHVRPSHVKPLWLDPDSFVREAIDSDPDRFFKAKSILSIYQLLRAPTGILVNDSGMLAAVLPEIIEYFPGAKFVHVVRDGRVVSYVAARKIMQDGSSNELIRKKCSRHEFESVFQAQAKYWCWILDRVESVRCKNPDSFLTVRYEDFCKDPQRVFLSVREFVGIKNGVCDEVDLPFHGPVNENLNFLRDMGWRSRVVARNIQEDWLVRFGYE